MGRGVRAIMTFEELVQIIADHRNDGECIQECYEAVAQNLLRPVGERFWGSKDGLRASSHLAIWQRRERTTWEAGIPTLGFETALQNLAARSPDERLLLCPL